MAEADRAIEPVPDSVRTPVRDRSRHEPERLVGSGPTVQVVEAGYSAHQAIILVLPE